MPAVETNQLLQKAVPVFCLCEFGSLLRGGAGGRRSKRRKVDSGPMNKKKEK